MAETGLGPNELDLLEDALEELELEGVLDRWSGDELGPRVLERLADYRSILVASREALPFEDVPVGVLDGVLEQARQAAAAAPMTAAGGSVESWWGRMRRGFMAPALAVAGTAVLVFWVFDPSDAEEAARIEPTATHTSAPNARGEAAAGNHADATPSAPLPKPGRAVQAEDKKDKEAEGKVAEEAEPSAETVQAQLDPEKNADAKHPAPTSSAADRSGQMGSLGDAQGAQAGLGGAAGPASGRWDIVSRGDRARQAGDCVAARDEYALALEDDEARVRARAFAGLGLCDAAAGDEVSADANYQRARELDDATQSFIDSQNQRNRGATKSNKTASPKKSKKASVDAFDPF